MDLRERPRRRWLAGANRHRSDAGDPGGHLMRVLIVEDEPPIARRLEKMVRELLGGRLAKLEMVETLLSAERFLAGDCIDLLLLDLNLHGASGFVLLEKAVSGSFHTVI